MPYPRNNRSNGKPPPGTQINRSHALANGLVCQMPVNEGSGTSVWDYAGQLPGVQYIPQVIDATSAGLTTTIVTTQSLDQFFKNEYIRPVVSALSNTGVYQITAVSTAAGVSTLTITPALNAGASAINDTFVCVPQDLVWARALRGDAWIWGGSDNPVIDWYPGSTNKFLNPLITGMERQIGMPHYDPFYAQGPQGQLKDTGNNYTMAVLYQPVGVTTATASYCPDGDGSDAWGVHLNVLGAGQGSVTFKQSNGTNSGGTTNIVFQSTKWCLQLWTLDPVNGGKLYSNSTLAGVATNYPILQQTISNANPYQTWKGGTGAGDQGLIQTGSTASKRGHLWFNTNWLLNQGSTNTLANFQGKFGSYWIWRRALSYEEIVRFYARPWGMYQQQDAPFHSFGAISSFTPWHLLQRAGIGDI